MGVGFALHSRVLRLGTAGIALLWLSAPLLAQAPAQQQSSAASRLVQRFLSRADDGPTRYRALRRLEAHNARFKLHGWVEAWTELTADGRFGYTIVREGGSEYMRKKMKSMLEDEQRLFATRDPSQWAFTPRNYELGDAEQTEAGLVRLEVKPRRDDVSLVDGAVFLTKADGDLVRVEGRLAKNPSFWTTRVDLVRRYGRLAGVRVPLRVDTVAHVRLAGVSTLSVTYDYEMIDGRPVAASAAVAAQP